MSAALSRYANAGQPIGHAGPDAPIHADERFALADLPRLAESPQAAADGFRAMLQQKEVERLREQNRLFFNALRDIAVGGGVDARIASAALRRASLV